MRKLECLQVSISNGVLWVAVCLHSAMFSTVTYGASIQGTIYYNGTRTGNVLIAALTEQDLGAVAAQTSIPAPGAYTLTCPSGSYYIVAQLDLDGSGALSFVNPLEPLADSCGMVVLGDETLTGTDVYLPDVKQGVLLNAGFDAAYASGTWGDMAYHDGYLWICETHHGDAFEPDLHKVAAANGSLVESINLGMSGLVYSDEWIGDDLWVCYMDPGLDKWRLRKFSLQGTVFIPGVTYDLPSSTDWDIVWSLNIAWDGNVMWVQEKGENWRIYKVNLADGSIVETILFECPGYRGSRNLSDFSDICFVNGFLWAMDDGNPIAVQVVDLNMFEQRHTYFDVDEQSSGEDGTYVSMAIEGDQVFFLQRYSDGPSKLYAGRLPVPHDWNGDGIVSIIGDVPPFVQCVYFNNCAGGVDPVTVGDCNHDGILSIIGDVPCFVQCVYFGQCGE